MCQRRPFLRWRIRLVSFSYRSITLLRVSRGLSPKLLFGQCPGFQHAPLSDRIVSAIVAQVVGAHDGRVGVNIAAVQIAPHPVGPITAMQAGTVAIAKAAIATAPLAITAAEVPATTTAPSAMPSMTVPTPVKSLAMAAPAMPVVSTVPAMSAVPTMSAVSAAGLGRIGNRQAHHHRCHDHQDLLHDVTLSEIRG